MNRSILRIAVLSLAFACSPLLFAAPVTAFAGLDNASGDPRYDYLSEVFSGILLFDLSPRLDLVERARLAAVLREQALSLSALSSDSGAASKAGKIMGADWILAGSYSITGTEVSLVCTLVHAETARAFVYRERGADENVAHRIAEAIVLKLTGDTAKFADPSRKRSVLSLRDETPGSISLYSPLIDAEVSVDGTFAGYTTGNPRTPFLIEKLSPGAHKVKTWLGRDFGVVKKPQIEFSPWEAEVTVEGGKTVVVRDLSRHFGDYMWNIVRFHPVDLKAAKGEWGKLAGTRDVSYTDRSGAVVQSLLKLYPLLKGSTLSVAVTLESKGAKAESLLAVDADAGGEKEITLKAGDLETELSLEFYNDSWRLEGTVLRTDVSTEEWRKLD